MNVHSVRLRFWLPPICSKFMSRMFQWHNHNSTIRALSIDMNSSFAVGKFLRRHVDWSGWRQVNATRVLHLTALRWLNESMKIGRLIAIVWMCTVCNSLLFLFYFRYILLMSVLLSCLLFHMLYLYGLRICVYEIQCSCVFVCVCYRVKTLFSLNCRTHYFCMNSNRDICRARWTISSSLSW